LRPEAPDDHEKDRSPPGRAAPWRLPHALRAGIARRLLLHVLLFSSLITLLLTLAQLYADYRREVGAIDLRMAQIDSGYRRSLGEGLWRLDARQLQLQAEGILRLPDIRYVELREATDGGEPLVVTAGTPAPEPALRRVFSLPHANHGVEQVVGTLVVEATFEQVYQRLLHTAAVIVASQAVKTFVVSLFILLVVHRLITRHLSAMAASMEGFELPTPHAPLRLERPAGRSADELDHLALAFNRMYARLQAAYGDIREREAKLRSLVDANIIGICIFDRDRRITEANDAFLAMVGRGPDDVRAGRLDFGTMTPPEWASSDERQLEALRATGTWPPREKEFFRQDGSRVPVLVGGVRFGESRRQGIAFVVDLSERKRAESELAHAHRVTTMGHLSASIAHEVNQPLTGVMVSAETALRLLAGDRPDLAAVKGALGRVVRDGRRAGEIVDRIRALLRKTPPRRVAFDVNDLILETVNLTHGEATRSGVQVRTQLHPGLLAVRGDRVQLQQVTLNLIINAIDAMRDAQEGPREILVSTAPADAGEVHVRVQDSGPGIAPADIDRVFDAFHTTKSTGLGLGLSICRSIVEAHGGRLWVTANDPRGASFQFSTPTDAGASALH